VTVEGVEFVEISAGYYLAGSCFLCDRGDLPGRLTGFVGGGSGRPPRHARRECPRRFVEIASPFLVARTEVTNAQYARFDPARKWTSFSPGDLAPAVVSEAEARDYCAWLARRSGLRVRLPGSAVWEYAARGGAGGEFGGAADEASLRDFAWFDRNSGGYAHDAATRRPNGFGLHDLNGNIAEWCVGRLGELLRAGGSAKDGAERCRAASREGGSGPGAVAGVRPVFGIP
jgi:formylglycine-generating enzyme required for sulfatase activity